MTNTTPRTRRQLREALSQVESQLHEQRRQTDYAENQLRKLGAIEGGIITTSTGYGYPVAHRSWDIGAIATKPSLFIGGTRVFAQGEASAAVEAVTNVAVATTRRETLEAVIDGLKLSEYDYREPGAYYYGFRTDGDQRPGHERLWSDIQTALEVRAEKKREDERQATAKKVSRLTDPALFAVGGFTFFTPTIGFDPAAPKVVDLEDAVKIATEVPRTVTVDKPKPKKKPAAKKSEGKK